MLLGGFSGYYQSDGGGGRKYLSKMKGDTDT